MYIKNKIPAVTHGEHHESGALRKDCGENTMRNVIHDAAEFRGIIFDSAVRAYMQ